LSNKPTNIALFRLSAMGDVAMLVPIIRTFVAQYPSVKVIMVSRSFFEPFFKNIPNVTFFQADLDNRHKGILGLFRLFLDLKKLEIDGFIDLHAVLRSKIVRTFCAFSGIKVAFTNKGRAEKKQLTRSKNKIFEPLKTVFERHQEAFLKLGFSIDLSNPEFSQNAVLSSHILKITQPKATFNWIGIAPFAQYQSKIYPLVKLQNVIIELALNPNNKLFLFGAANTEIEKLNLLSKGIENATVTAGKLTLSEELDLISNLDLMLSMDSGNGHLAAMFGIKTITLWGATHPFVGFAPFRQPLSNSLVANREKYPFLPTSVYGKKEVKGYQNAMTTISEKAIVDLIYANLNN
jgi:ADP-heptose:LPS heptosyltransferase